MSEFYDYDYYDDDPVPGASPWQPPPDNQELSRNYMDYDEEYDVNYQESYRNDYDDGESYRNDMDDQELNRNDYDDEEYNRNDMDMEIDYDSGRDAELPENDYTETNIVPDDPEKTGSGDPSFFAAAPDPPRERGRLFPKPGADIDKDEEDTIYITDVLVDFIQNKTLAGKLKRTAVLFVFILYINLVLFQSVYQFSLNSQYEKTINPFKIFFVTIREHHTILALSAIMALMATFIIFYVVQKRRKMKEPKDFEISNTNTYGDAIYATDEEMNRDALEFYQKDRPYGLITCLSDKGEAACVPHGGGRNENVAVFGATGSGKTFGYAKPNILMCIDRGFSAIVTDPSGELFTATYKLAIAKGVEVRVLNLKSIDASNGWNCLTPLIEMGPDDYRSDILAMSLVKTILSNAKGEDNKSDNYFDLLEENMFACLIKYVALSPNFVGEEHERHLGTCYDILTEITKNGGEYPFFDEFFEMYPTDPAASAWKIYKGYGSKQRESAMSGLEGKIHIFQTDLIKEVFSHNEIDLSLPGRKQCIYYVISSFQDESFTPLFTLFFSLTFQVLIQEAEKNLDKKLKVPTMFILDEFKAIGRINRFSDIMANVRKYRISLSIIFQDIAQLEKAYPHESISILSNCDTWVVLGVNDQETAKAMADRSGEATIKTESKRAAIPLYKPHIVTEEAHTEADGQRLLLTPHQVITLSEKGKILIIARGHNVYLAEKYGFIYHYLAGYINNEDNHMLDMDYVPKWREEQKTLEKGRTYLTGDPMEVLLARQSTGERGNGRRSDMDSYDAQEEGTQRLRSGNNSQNRRKRDKNYYKPGKINDEEIISFDDF